MPERAILVAGLAAAVAGCTLDAGEAPDAAACEASRDYFVAHIQGEFFVAHGCATERDCHDYSRGHGTLRLRPWESPPPSGSALADWPIGWRENYLSAIQQLDCAEPLASRLLTIPEGLGNIHPPGPVISDRPDAGALIDAWVAAPR
jgi:hypothetical protein